MRDLAQQSDYRDRDTQDRGRNAKDPVGREQTLAAATEKAELALSTKEAEAAKLAAELDERSIFAATNRLRSLSPPRRTSAPSKNDLMRPRANCMRRTNAVPPIGSNLIQRFSK